MTATTSSPSAPELVSWTHLWFAGAVHTLDALDARWDDDDLAGSIGARDALTIMLIDAIRNVVRGAVRVLGPGHAALTAFDIAQPNLKDLRDRLEHFDDYLLGTGRQQDAAAPSLPMTFRSSSGTNDGHIVHVTVEEKSGKKEYQLQTVRALADARTLMLAVLSAQGRDDDIHRERCWLCRPEIARE
jgi:hypothetical protein